MNKTDGEGQDKSEKTVTGGRKKGQNRNTLIVIGAELVVAIAVVALIFLWPDISKPASAPSSDSSAPGQIAGRALRGLVTGDEAVSQLKQMHGKGVGVRGGWIAQYDGGGTIWYGVTSSTSEATSVIEQMTSRISQGNQTFTDLKTLEMGPTRMYSVKGQGQTHYYYASGAATIWITLPTEQGGDFLHEALTSIQ